MVRVLFTALVHRSCSPLRVLVPQFQGLLRIRIRIRIGTGTGTGGGYKATHLRTRTRIGIRIRIRTRSELQIPQFPPPGTYWTVWECPEQQVVSINWLTCGQAGSTSPACVRFVAAVIGGVCGVAVARSSSNTVAQA